jgi:UDPglucose 6-dehydrogenase
MKKFNSEKFAKDIYKLRKEKKYFQTYIEEKTGISGIILGKMEKNEFMPSIEKVELLCELFGLEPINYFMEEEKVKSIDSKPVNIVVAGTGYVELSLAVLLAQHNHVTAVDVIPEKVEKINNHISPVQGDYIE